MPIYEFEAKETGAGCAYCCSGFELLMRLSDPAPVVCPSCGQPVRKKISATSVGASKSGFNARAKAAGFHQLKKTGKGEYQQTF